MSPHQRDTVLNTSLSKNGTSAELCNGNCEAGNKPTIQVYSKRVWMLFIFSVCSLLNNIQSVEYASITDINACYYGVSDFDVDWMTLIYMVVYIPLVFPSIWFLERFGLRKTVLMGSFLTCLSTVIQCASLNPDGFSIALVSQFVAGIAQPFILPVPPRLATVWFAASEVCRATAIGVFGNQLGAALGFIFAPYVVPNDCSERELIHKGKCIETYTLAASNIVVFLLLVVTFEEKPPIPPNLAEATKEQNTFNLKKSLKALLSNINFDLLLVSYGIIVGAFLAIATILNEMLSPLFPGSEEEIGWMGLIIVIAGLIGSMVAGFILDATHKFKETSVAIFILTFLSMCLFSGLLYVGGGIWLQFLSITILGFFLTSYIPVGFELAAEITYPEPEGTTAGLLNASTMGMGILLAMAGSTLIEKFSVLYCNLFFCAILFLSCIVTGFIKCECKRTAQNMGKGNKASQHCNEYFS